MPRFDAEVGAILARLRRARVVCSDETSVRVAGKTCWVWVFQNGEVVTHVIRNSRGAGVVAEVMEGRRLAIWVSDLYSAQQGHAADWQVCLAHQLRDCQFAIEVGDTIFAPRMKALLVRAFALARRRHHLAASTRRQHRARPRLCRRHPVPHQPVAAGHGAAAAQTLERAWPPPPSSIRCTPHAVR
jgi:transposase